MKSISTFFTLFVLFNLAIESSYGQLNNFYANRALSNLSQTAINRSLIPAESETINLGSAKAAWNNIYSNGVLFKDSSKVMIITDADVALGFGTLAKNKQTSFGGYSNTAIGNGALESNINGYLNTAVGVIALNHNTNGWWNVAVGTECLSSNTNGTENTAMGEGALFANTSGRSNSAVGSQAMSYMQTGLFNTAIGEAAMGICTYGSNNTAIGEYTLHQSEASGNTALGTDAGSYYPNGDNNTFVGFNSNSNNLYLTNTTSIGYDVHVTSSNSVRVGNSAVTSIGGFVDWTSFSDGRYKKNIKEDVPGIAFIKSLRPITYTLDAKGLDDYFHKDMPVKKDAKGNVIDQPASDKKTDFTQREKIIYTGFVAQEVEAAARKLNYSFSGVDAPENDKSLYGLRYADFVVPLVKAVQELNTKNDSLTNALTHLQQEMDQLKVFVMQTSTAADNPNNSQASVLNTVSLKQNFPNPSNQTTAIIYSLPKNYRSAGLTVTNDEGKIIKQINITNNTGTLTLDVSKLPAGTYTYTLIENGAVAASKLMEVIK